MKLGRGRRGVLLKLNHHGNFNNIPRPFCLHCTHTEKKEEMSFKTEATLQPSSVLFLTPAKQHRHHRLDKDLATILPPPPGLPSNLITARGKRPGAAKMLMAHRSSLLLASNKGAL